MREKIYKAIDTERDYQDSKWGIVDDPNYQSYDEAHFILDIEEHLNQAKKAMYNIDRTEVMNQFRKIAALAVKCGEVHGMPERVLEN